MDILCHYHISAERIEISQEVGEGPQIAPHVIIGTPDHVNEMIQRNAIQTTHVKFFCIDEFDWFFSRGFVSVLEKIRMALPQDTQAALLSNSVASGSASMLQIAEAFTKDAIVISPSTLIAHPDLKFTLESVQQFFVYFKRKKYMMEEVARLCVAVNPGRTIVYCGAKSTVVDLANKLEKRNVGVTTLVSYPSLIHNPPIYPSFISPH